MKKLSPVVSALIMIIAGVLLFVYPATSLLAAVRLLGVAVLLYGAFGLVANLSRKSGERSVLALAYSAIVAILGIIIIASPDFIISVFPIVAGVLIAISGVESLMKALSLKKSGDAQWTLLMILSLITIAFGILIFANPFGTQATLVRVFACGLVYDGVVNLIAGVKSK